MLYILSIVKISCMYLYVCNISFFFLFLFFKLTSLGNLNAAKCCSLSFDMLCICVNYTRLHTQWMLVGKSVQLLSIIWIQVNSNRTNRANGRISISANYYSLFVLHLFKKKANWKIHQNKRIVEKRKGKQRK